jgi:hypothetical protein
MDHARRRHARVQHGRRPSKGAPHAEEGPVASDTIDALAKKYIDQDKYPWAQPGDERVNLRLNVERELGI